MAEITPKGVASYPGGEQKYVDDILRLLLDISSNPVGWIILEHLLRTRGQLTIWPESERPVGSFDPNRIYTGSTAATLPVNPAGKPDYARASPRGLSRSGTGLRDKWYAGKNDNPDTEDVDERNDAAPPAWGDPTGAGSDDRIYFTPGKAGGSDKSCARGSGECASLDDEILLHEMVHALRDMQGVTNPVPTSSRYKNEEEFLALVVTNVYVSRKKGNKLLRWNYERVGPLPPPFNTSDGFMIDGENKSILQYYATAWQPVFGRLGTVETVFNPFSWFSKKP